MEKIKEHLIENGLMSLKKCSDNNPNEYKKFESRIRECQKLPRGECPHSVDELCSIADEIKPGLGKSIFVRKASWLVQ